MKDAQFSKLVLFTSSLVPAALLAWDWLSGAAGPDPAYYLITNTGILALFFLCLSLCVTPLRRLSGKNFWSLYRRQLGLYAFFYAGLHLLSFIFLYKGGSLAAVIDETFKRKFIFFGMAAFLLMVPLAATSTAAAVKWLGGKRWKLLHKLVYLSAIGAILHYLMSTKLGLDLSTFEWPELNRLQRIYLAAVVFLLGFRLVAWIRDRKSPKSPKKPAADAQALP